MRHILTLGVDAQIGSLQLLVHPGVTLRNEGSRWLVKTNSFEVFISKEHTIAELLDLVEFRDRNDGVMSLPCSE